MAAPVPKTDESIFRFILRERFLTLTVIGSIFTFAFINSLKSDIIDPLLQFMLSEENFGFMDITIREGEKMPPIQRQIELRFGNFFREFVTWLLIITTLYVLYKFTGFPDQITGNPGVAVV
jgi:large-conductance mechanosensitive channel